jgi:hypothetical protein
MKENGETEVKKFIYRWIYKLHAILQEAYCERTVELSQKIKEEEM